MEKHSLLVPMNIKNIIALCGQNTDSVNVKLRDA
jgi:hypothetical protein